MLPEIVKAVGNRCEIFLDSGVRYGTDIFKAIALGAKMVYFNLIFLKVTQIIYQNIKKKLQFGEQTFSEIKVSEM